MSESAFYESELSRAEVQKLVKSGALKGSALVDALEAESVETRRNAVQGVGIPAQLERLGMGPLLLAAKDSDAVVRAYALDALRPPGAEFRTSLPLIFKGLDDSTVLVQKSATEALAAFIASDKETVLELFFANLPKPVPEVALERAAAVLAEVEGVLAVVVHQLRTTTVSSARVLSAQVLENLGPDASESLDDLVEGLGDPAPEVRLACARALAAVAAQKSDEEEEEELTPALAIERLGIKGFGDKALEEKDLAKGELDPELLMVAMLDPREHVRINVARAFKAVGLTDPRALGSLIKLLATPGPETRREIMTILVEKPFLVQSRVSDLLVMLQDSDEEVRTITRKLVIEIAEESEKELLGALQAPEGQARKGVFPVFLELGEKAVPILARALSHGSALVRVNAALLLREIGPPAAAAEEALLVAKEDNVSQVRDVAQLTIYALGIETPPPKALKALQDAVAKDDNEEVRSAARAAAVALQNTGKRVAKAPTRIAKIEVPGFSVRLMPASELKPFAKEIELEELLVALTDGRDAMRANAAQALALAKHDKLEVSEPLRLLLKDGSSLVRRETGRALVKLKKVSESLLAALVEVLDERDEGVLESYIDAVSGLGEKALPLLKEGLGLAHGRKAIVPVMVAIGEKAVPWLIEALDHPDLPVRLNACHAFFHLGGELSSPARDAIKTAIYVDNRIGVEAYPVLKKINTYRKFAKSPLFKPEIPLPASGFAAEPLDADALEKAREAFKLEDLVALAQDGRPMVRVNAAYALSTLGEGLDTVVMMLRDSDVGVRRAAAGAIRNYGAALEAHVPWVAEAIMDPDETVGELALEALVVVGQAKAEALLSGLEMPQGVAEKTVLRAFEPLGAAGAAALAGQLTSDSSRVRANAASGLIRLAKTGAEAHREALEGVLGDETAGVREAAAAALAAIDAPPPKPSALEPVELPTATFADSILSASTLKKEKKNLDPALLERFLKDGRDPVRANAATCFGVLKSYTPGLLALLKDSSPEVRATAASALGLFGNSLPAEALSALLDGLASANGAVQDAILSALDAAGEALDPVLVEGLAATEAHVLLTVGLVASRRDDTLEGVLLGALGDDTRSGRSRANAVLLLRELGLDENPAVEDAIEAYEASLKPPASVRELPPLTIRKPDVLEPEPLPMDGFAEEVLEDDVLAKAAKKFDVERLAKALYDGRAIVRENAVRSLGHVGKKAEASVTAIALLLKDSDSDVAVAAAEALGRLTPAPDISVPALVYALKGASAELEGEILEALGAYKKNIVDPVVQELDKYPQNIGPLLPPVIGLASKDFAGPLVEMLEQNSRLKVKEMAANLVRSLGSDAEKARNALLEAVDYDGGRVAFYAVMALGECKTTKAVQEKLESLAEEDIRLSVRRAARSVLRKLEGN